MKNLFLLLVLALSSHLLTAQTEVVLHLHHKLGDQTFAHNQAAMAPGNYAFQVNRMQYYVSQIKLIHDGAQVTPIEGLHLLVTAPNDKSFSLGSFNVTNIEGIEFSIGVSPAYNHLDPASYPVDHPLYYQSPSMHWGWAGGYRYICMEGKASNNGVSFPDNYQIHTVDTTNFLSQTHELTAFEQGDALGIHLDADYVQALVDISVQGGVFAHGGSGPAYWIARNFRDRVFSPTTELPTSTETVPVAPGVLRVSPNPVQGTANVQLDFQGYERLTLSVLDLTGRLVYEQTVQGAQSLLVLESHNWPAGMYLATVRSGQQVLAVEKLIVR
jgi:hypothetical protein